MVTQEMVRRDSHAASISKLLLVSEDPAARVVLAVALEEAGHHVTTAESPDAASRRLSDEPFDVVVCDVEPARRCVDLCETARARDPDLGIVVLTPSLPPEDARRLDRMGDTARVAQPGLMLFTAIELALRARGRQKTARRRTPG